MKPVTFSMLLLLQRVDEALRIERRRGPRSPILLHHRRALVAGRLERSRFAAPTAER